MEKKIKKQPSVEKKLGTQERFLIFVNRFFKWIIVLVVAIVLVAGYFLVLSSQYNKLMTTKGVDLAELDETIERLDSIVSSMSKSIDQSVTFTSVEERLLSLMLPDEFDIGSLAIQLEGLAKEFNFVVESISVEKQKKLEKGTQKKKSGLQKVGFKIGVVGGNYDDFKRFLSAMEESIMVFDIAAISFPDLNAVNPVYEIDVTTYYYIE